MNNDNCIFPLCSRKAVRNEFCFLHAVHFAGERIKNKPKPIPIKSVKRMAEDKLLKKISNELKAISDRCELKSPVCTGKMEGLDHTQKTSPKNRLNRKNLKRSCNACNQYKEDNPTWANKKNHSISRFKK